MLVMCKLGRNYTSKSFMFLIFIPANNYKILGYNTVIFLQPFTTIFNISEIVSPVTNNINLFRPFISRS